MNFEEFKAEALTARPNLSLSRIRRMYSRHQANAVDIIFDDCKSSTPISCEKEDLPKEQESKMNYANATVIAKEAKPLEYTQLSHLAERLAHIVQEKKVEHREVFKMDAPRPKTWGEAKERIAKKQFTIDIGEYKDTDNYYGGLFSFFSWRTEPADEAGYFKADEKMLKAKIEVEDQFLAFDYEESLKALKAFEAKKFH